MANSTNIKIQLRPVGSLWRVYVNGVCRAFCANYRAARYRAEQLQTQFTTQQLGGVA